MPMDHRDYPADWKRLSRDLRDNRAGGRCEHPGCGAPNGTMIRRRITSLECWTPRDSDAYAIAPDLWRGPVKVVLTCAHTCECRPICGNPEHIVVLCQLHHLRLDARQHAENARETRRAKRLGPKLPGLP